MAITTYRSVDQNDDTIKYVCEYAYDGGRHYPESGSPVAAAETVLCEARSDRLDAGEQEVRVHDDSSQPTHTFRFSKGKVSAEGIEPSTFGLRVRCSAS